MPSKVLSCPLMSHVFEATRLAVGDLKKSDFHDLSLERLLFLKKKTQNTAIWTDQQTKVDWGRSSYSDSEIDDKWIHQTQRLLQKARHTATATALCTRGRQTPNCKHGMHTEVCRSRSTEHANSYVLKQTDTTNHEFQLGSVIQNKIPFLNCRIIKSWKQLCFMMYNSYHGTSSAKNYDGNLVIHKTAGYCSLPKKINFF